MSKISRKSNQHLPRNRQVNQSASLEVRQEMSFQTHLLPAPLLKEYNQIIPGFAKDIHDEFLSERKARRSANTWLVRGTIVWRFTGQIAAFLLAAFIFWIGWDLGTKGHDWLAGTLATADVVALVSVFLGVQYFGKKREKQTANTEEEETSEEVDEES